jgi:hypothetical protein
VDQFGSVAALSQSAIAAVLTSSAFGANGAATFLFDGGTFLALNDGVAGFQEGDDAIIDITGYSGNLDDLLIV